MKRLLSPYLLLALNCPAMILTLTLTLTLILTVTLIYLMRIFADKGLTSMQYVKLAV